MGPTVLDAGAPGAPSLHVYAHCLRGVPGGVAMLVINTDRAAAQDLELATATDRYTLTAPKLDGAIVQLNGTELKLGADDAIPRFTAAPAAAGRLTFEPASITFLAVPNANHWSCR